MAVRCRSCSKVLDARSQIELFDGKLYCIACVRGSCPSVLKLVRESRPLEDRIGLGKARIKQYVRYKYGAMAKWLLLCVWLPLGVVAPFGGREIVSVAVGLSCVGLAVLGIMLLIEAFVKFPSFHASVPRRVRIHRGIVTLRIRDSVVESELPACRWWLGRVRETQDILLVPDDDAVVLIVPLPAGERRVACGVSGIDYGTWREFLTTADVPQSERISLSSEVCRKVLPIVLTTLVVALLVGLRQEVAVVVAMAVFAFWLRLNRLHLKSELVRALVIVGFGLCGGLSSQAFAQSVGLFVIASIGSGSVGILVTRNVRRTDDCTRAGSTLDT